MCSSDLVRQGIRYGFGNVVGQHGPSFCEAAVYYEAGKAGCGRWVGGGGLLVIWPNLPVQACGLIAANPPAIATDNA